jgi:hypothetical protein
MTLPAPRPDFGIGHLGRWARDPLGLIEEGARLGPVFKLKLWRRTTLGYSPAWNRFVLGDLETFRSQGSMSGLTPTSAEELSSWTRRSIGGAARSSFDAVAWSAALMRETLPSCAGRYCFTA